MSYWCCVALGACGLVAAVRMRLSLDKRASLALVSAAVLVIALLELFA